MKSGVAIDPPPTVSLHQRILSDIEDRILSGLWPPGHRIPSELDLTAEYGCSRMTVNKALTQLANAGMIDRRRKSGSVVKRTPSRSAVLQIHDIRAEVLALGVPYRFEITERRKRRSVRADAAAIDLDEAGSLLQITALHYAGPRPFCLEQRLINLTTVPAAAAQPFDSEAPGAWLAEHVPWTTAEHRIRAASADAEMAKVLKMRIGTACLVIERRTWIGGKSVTFARLSYPGEDHELLARFSPSTAIHGRGSDNGAT